MFLPPWFIDPDHPQVKVYRWSVLFYGVHHSTRAWYETLANYLLGNGFKIGKIDQTLFIKKQKGDILLVQVYVDDIIFSSTNKALCTGFEKLMKDKFQMISMGELTFFLGFQVQKKEEGIFISQDKYVVAILKKFNYTDVKSASTPVDLKKPLVKDVDADDVDVHLYRSMIGSLMYLTASRPDIMFAVCKPTLGLWYSRDSPFELVAYTDSDYAGATQYRKSTTVGCQFLGNRLTSWQCKKKTVVATSTTEAEYVAAASCCRQIFLPKVFDAGSCQFLVSISTAKDISGAETLVYIRRSASKAKDKRKAIMQESEPLKKIKKRVQVQMSVDEELAKKVFEEEQARFNAEQEARLKVEQEQETIDFERALKMQKKLDEKEEVVAKEAHDIDLSDPSVLRYHALQNRPFSVAEVRKNMCMYLKKEGGYKMSHLKRMSYE
ncbi:putative ribonuclease H-like domain-containing protein [Tanacetum coccineum]